MLDMRAVGFEPINAQATNIKAVWWYYKSARETATHFFFDYLPKGTHVFEYDIHVSHVGQFSNGVASIRHLYAPKFTSRSAEPKAVEG